MQVNVAPYDVRQGNFVGAGVNTVTRSGTNKFTASVYRRYAQRVRTSAPRPAGQAFNPGTFNTTATGVWAGGPIIKNKLFVFGSLREAGRHAAADDVPVEPRRRAGRRQHHARAGVRPDGAQQLPLERTSTTTPGPFDNISKATPAKPWLVKGDYNLNTSNKVTFRYNQLDSSTDVNQSGSSSLGTAAQTGTTQLPDLRRTRTTRFSRTSSRASASGTRCSARMTNNLHRRLHAPGREPRRRSARCSRSSTSATAPAAAYTAFGTEPFTPYNLLRYKHVPAAGQLHQVRARTTRSPSAARSRSSTRTTRSTSASRAPTSTTRWPTSTPTRTGILANPNRTVSPVTLRRFQVKYLLQPGQTTPPLQPLDVVYASGYVQDEWRPQSNLTVTAGLRVDVPKFGNTAFDNPIADALTFRDQDGSPVQYNSGALPDTTPLWSPRVGFNWDVAGDQNDAGARRHRPLHRQAALRLDLEPDRQHRRAVRIRRHAGNTTAFPFNPNPDKYKPAATGGRPPATSSTSPTRASVPADVAHQHRRRPQAAVGPDRNGRLHLQPRPQRAGLHQRQPAGGRSRPTPASTTGRAGSRRRAFPACITGAARAQTGPCVTQVEQRRRAIR